VEITCNLEKRAAGSGPNGQEVYAGRRLSDAYPGLDRLALENFSALLEMQPEDMRMFEKRLAHLDRLVDMSAAKNLLVIGCGPRPHVINFLAGRGYSVAGVEPVSSFVRAAREFVGSESSVLEGAAESIPVADGTQHLIFCDSVLEHVASVTKSLDEMYRVLAPGGIAYITTSNRYRFSLTGENGEYNKRFFNWLPGLVKECFVFKHLHYDPRLANYTELPAVHWFSYTELCRLGRQAGFSRFYSVIDLLEADDLSARRNRLKKILLNRVKLNPWMRALALTQLGGTIIMLKR
jgi:SAM-dependent methyltransferase